MRRRAAILALSALVATVATFAALSPGGDTSRPASPHRTLSTAKPPPGSMAAFSYLSQETTNRCDLQAVEIMSYSRSQRLQGSCCSPMDRKSYEHQVEHLRRYAHLSDIPRDPYDISARLAQRLLRHDRTIRLRGAQADGYRKAMRLSREKGPCCCPCWRWNAFRGLAKRLIAERDWSAPRLGALIEAIDGCGGEHAHA